MLGDSDFDVSEARDREAFAWVESVKVAAFYFLLGSLSTVWLLVAMGVL